MTIEKVKNRKGRWITDNGRILGTKLVRAENGSLLIEGSYRIRYGTIVDGKFMEFCSDTRNCNVRCPWAGKLHCRYSSKNMKTAGYYVEIPE